MRDQCLYPVSSLTQVGGVPTWLVVMLISTLFVASQVGVLIRVPILYLLIETYALVDLRFVTLTVAPFSLLL